MYVLFNTVEGVVIGNFTSTSELIDKVRNISLENEDYDFSILGVSDAIEYIDEFCDNLELIQIE